MQNNYYFNHNYDEEYTIRRGESRNHYDIDDDEYDYEDEYQEEYAYHSNDELEDNSRDEQQHDNNR